VKTVFLRLYQNLEIRRTTFFHCGDVLLRESKEHASVAYNSIGKHLARIRLNTTPSEGNLPTLLYKALSALQKHVLALSKLHLKVQPPLGKTPKYRQQSTQLMIPPDTVLSVQCSEYNISVQTDCTLIFLPYAHGIII